MSQGVQQKILRSYNFQQDNSKILKPVGSIRINYVISVNKNPYSSFLKFVRINSLRSKPLIFDCITLHLRFLCYVVDLCVFTR